MAASAITIRDFVAEDLNALQAIRERAFAPVFASFRELLGPTIAEVALATAESEQLALVAKFCDAKTPERVLVAVKGDAAAGFAAIALDDASKLGEITFLAVDPDHAGQGIGSALCRAALETMRAAGMKAASVGVGGDASHAAARRTYQKAGFGPAIPSQWMYREL